MREDSSASVASKGTLGVHIREVAFRVLIPFRSLFGFIHSQHPARAAILGYAWYVWVGWILLCLPVFHRGNAGTALDHLFTATSAISTTGLTTISVSDSYNFGGQVVVLVLIQLGGIGYMTFGSFLILSRGGLMPSERVEISQTIFSLPAGFRVDKFIRSVVMFTVLIEALGALALFYSFRRAGMEWPLWDAVFHSVSAFCTAGFGLRNNSFEDFAFVWEVNLILSVLSYLGAVGFIVLVDIWRRMIGQSDKITLTSKIIVGVTFWLSLAGTSLLFMTEPSLAGLSGGNRLLAAFFQCMTAMTTVGFNTVPISEISGSGLLVLIMLMIIGASPSGTGGGLKSTTFSAIWGVMLSAARGQREVRFWGHPVPLERIWTAFASLGFYTTALVAGTWLLALSESFRFEQMVFEAASALGTVGLSTGITGSLGTLGKIIVIGLMFCGRVGPMTFGIALFTHPVMATKSADPEDVAV